MQIKPLGWEFVPTTEFCCDAFKISAIDYGYKIIITTDGNDVFLEKTKISYCPFCGKKIIIERVMQ